MWVPSGQIRHWRIARFGLYMHEEQTIDIFHSTIQKTNEILKAVQEAFDWKDKHRAYTALRAVLQTLRDRLTIENVAAFGAQLPMLVRGFYYEGWKPSEAPIKMKKEEFVGEVERVLNSPLGENTEEIIKGVITIVDNYTDPIEIEKLKKTLPKDIQKIF
jgi:uncharacterized protein (DUF2267 family)